MAATYLPFALIVMPKQGRGAFTTVSVLPIVMAAVAISASLQHIQGQFCYIEAFVVCCASALSMMTPTS
jgi:predicted membrane channel-forming protein YqfA (hemolysin III family)